jgi:T5SS/PEP-CTERM-associated repeat protein
MKSLRRFSQIALLSCSYLTLLAMGVGFMTPARAANADWSGVSGSWFVSANWSTSVLPDATTTVRIGGGDAMIATGSATSSNAIIATGGEVDVSGAGNSWTNVGSSLLGYNLGGGAIIIGDTGQGTLLVENGGAVRTTGQTGSVLIGNSLGSTGIVTVGNGIGTSILTNAGPNGYPGNFYVGYDGTGTLNVNAGGSVSGFADMTVGVDAGSVGNVNVNGGSLNTSLNNGALTVGGQGIGTVSVTNGGQLTSSFATIGEALGSAGSSVTVDGLGSDWNITGAGLEIGTAAAGALTIQNSGVVNLNGASGQVEVSNGTATGTLTIDDGQLNGAGGSFYVGANSSGAGNVTVKNGGTLKTSFAYVGGGTFNHSGNGHVLVTGTGSSWDATLNASGVSVPSAITYLANPTGGAAVDIRSGGKLISGFTLIGNAGQPGATTQLTIDGSGSSWISRYEDLIGYYGSSYAVGQTQASSGSVTISGGATASSATMLVGVLADSGTPGVASDSLTVTGAGSNFTVSPANGLTGLFEVGYLGSGQVTVSAGATMNSTRGIIAFTSAAPGVFSIPNAPAMNSFGDVLVTGTGSIWTIDTSLIVGDNQQGTLGGYTVGTGTSQGTLTISDGATVSDASAVIGANIRATGTVAVTGAGSRWTTTGNVQLGPGGSGSLSVDDGATVSASDIQVYSQGTVTTGTGSINANVDGGTAGVGTLSTTDGTSTVNGNVGASAALGLVDVTPPTGNSHLTINGSLTATNTSISQNGTLTVGTGGAIGSVASAINDDGALIINHSDHVTLNGSISGSGSLDLQGTGIFTINGSFNPLTGLTTVEAGKLIVGDDAIPMPA